MGHVDYTRTLRVQLYDASRFHDGATAEQAGELHTVAFSKPRLPMIFRKLSIPLPRCSVNGTALTYSRTERQ